MRYVLAAFFAAAGLAHLLAPEALLAITPNWVPFPSQVILVTGLFEIGAAAGLLIRSTRKACGVALAVYALCVWPANFKHAFEGIDVGSMPLSWWYHGPRLALQPVIVWWALFASEVVDWPFAAGASADRDRT
jgi:uncharacterized membrane protein